MTDEDKRLHDLEMLVDDMAHRLKSLNERLEMQESEIQNIKERSLIYP